MILLDVNILVQVQREDADRHAAVRVWLEKEMRKPPGVSVSDLALSGCLRIITHPRIFNEPTPLERALEFVRDFRSRDEVRLLAPGPRHWEIFTELCRHGEARGNQIPDAYHAALAMEFGCTWLTMDRGFARFPGLEWRHPLDG
jgi:uncharacterized protein